jgi:hypothetical protein
VSIRHDGTHYVYLIATIHEGAYVAPVKVGITKDPASRVQSLQTASSTEIGLVHAIAVPDRSYARYFEDCFHQTQKEHRTRGEWFNLTPHRALLLLCLHMRFALDLFKVEPDLKREVLEVSGAGSAAEHILKELRQQGGASWQ